MKNERWGMMLAGMYGAGALTMYFLDPQRGKRRRITLADAVVHSGHDLQKFAGKFRRDFENRVEGAVAETQGLFEQEEVTDYVLEQRVRTALGRTLSHPHAVQVSCKDGSVYMSGWVLADEVKELTREIKSIRGVKDVSTFFNTTDHPQHIPALQGGVPRVHLPEFLQERWSPTARVVAGCAGVGLIAYGLLRQETIAKAAGLGGAALLARSVFNTSLGKMAGVDRTAGLQVQKTIYIDARADDLYEFWSNPENYPTVFSHVDAVTKEGEGVYRWEIAGPAGVSLTWSGEITRQVPGRIVEWHSLPESAVENHGTVHLDEDKNGRTRVQIQMSYNPPAGLLGHAFAALLGVDPKGLMDQDFVRLKALFEEGKTRAHGREVKKSELKIAHPPAS